MHEKLKEAAEHINRFENEVRQEASSLRNSGNQEIHPVSPVLIEGGVCAVDSGFVTHSIHGIDIGMVKTACVCFNYKNSELVSHEYFPSKFPEIKIEIKTALDEHELSVYRSLFRLKHEVSLAIESLEKFSPKILMLDGSILPLPGDRPPESSKVFPVYKEIIDIYKKLYSLSKEKNCLLLGVIKDSRGRRFIECSGVKANTSDTFFLDFLLNQKERTSVMSYSDKKQAILKDLGEFSDKLKLFYIKSVEGDRPMRIEFLDNGADPNTIASLVYSLSALNSNYAYPPVLIEADLCAALDQRQIEQAQNSLSLLSDSIKPLRRNSRPFR